MIIVFIVTGWVLMYILQIVLSILGLIFILFVTRKANSKLNLVETKKQRTVSCILNPKNKDTEAMLRTKVYYDEENQDQIVERLKNAYIHPCEKTFHAPVFKRRSRKSSVRYLFEIETDNDIMKKARSEGDQEEYNTTFSSKESVEESKSAYGGEDRKKLNDEKSFP
mmetsp:Transcript_31073/g.27482  ORF Transcript_31073/g.27482 Transcript_31073/m.27482 type:complete len:167 (-) Transcript_31073:63-563(-)